MDVILTSLAPSHDHDREEILCECLEDFRSKLRPADALHSAWWLATTLRRGGRVVNQTKTAITFKYVRPQEESDGYCSLSATLSSDASSALFQISFHNRPPPATGFTDIWPHRSYIANSQRAAPGLLSIIDGHIRLPASYLCT